ncbi:MULTISPECIES: hypothetical protein [unclassified Pseudoalteromonas]|uniref:DUF6966 domain-containing protein n=1 Tax=unclassified Pseudoalteromonas TaxID=194690 RepID=UPI00209842CE|nr:hypothetical protein [Pseudoalteromonas sp. XMcav2-N]MCO7191305.1 hypothetical protein [Pseudoalteromonas sp. XMcav2-N]
MKHDYGEYQIKLERMIDLLHSHDELHWANYFKKSAEFLSKGQPQKSIYHALGAYGGMGSINDCLTLTGASEQDAKLGLQLRHELWLICKSKQSMLKRILEF